MKNRSTLSNSHWRGLMAALVFTLVALAENGFAEKRVALIIGNSDYEYAADLPNACNDAIDLAKLLKSLKRPDGSDLFDDVRLQQNRTRRQMVEDLAQLTTVREEGGLVLFFYSGHGLVIDGENYLQPVDAELIPGKGKAVSKTRCINVRDSLRDLSDGQEGGLTLAILDCCRNNPYENFKAGVPTSALRPMGKGEIPDGQLVVFATTKGDVADDGGGRNSPFTGSLLQHLPTRGVEALTLMKRVVDDVRAGTFAVQKPEITFSYSGEFVLVPGKTDREVAIAQAQAEAEEALNKALKEKQDAEADLVNARQALKLSLQEQREVFEEQETNRLAAEIERQRREASEHSSMVNGLTAEVERLKGELELAEGKPIYFDRLLDGYADSGHSEFISRCLDLAEANSNQLVKDYFISRVEAELRAIVEPNGASFAGLTELVHGLGIDLLERAGEAGSTEAMILVGEYLVSVKGDRGTAFKCYSKAAEAGSDRGKFLQAECYFKGSGVKPDKVKAIRALEGIREDAWQDMPEVPYTLAGFSANAETRVALYKEARLLLKAAVARGEVKYYAPLGKMLISGLGGPPAPKDGFAFLVRGAEAKDRNAMHFLGAFLFQDIPVHKEIGISADREKGMKLIIGAARLGHLQAQQICESLKVSYQL